MALPTGDRAYTTHVGDAQPSTEFIEAVAKLVQKQRVRVKQHLQVCVQAHQVHLRAPHEKEWDERHARQGLSHRFVAESIDHDRARPAALAAAAGKLIIFAATTWPPRRVSGCIVRNVFGHCALVHLRVQSMWRRGALCSLGVRAWTSVYL